MKNLSISLLGLLALWACYSPPSVQAECRVLTSPETYTAGQVVRDVCDVNGARTITTGVTGSTAATATSTAAAPSYVEGSTTSPLSLDLSGNLRTTLGTLLSGEDQTNNLLMTSGGAVRTTTFSSVTSATSSAVTTVNTGSKTFVAQIINSTSETKAATVLIYGNLISSTTGGILLCTITLPSTATVLQLQDACPVVTANFPYYFYTASVYTSASSAPLTVYATY